MYLNCGKLTNPCQWCLTVTKFKPPILQGTEECVPFLPSSMNNTLYHLSMLIGGNHDNTTAHTITVGVFCGSSIIAGSLVKGIIVGQSLDAAC